MADARNRIEKELQRETTRLLQARRQGPPAPPFVPKCVVCSLNYLREPKPDGTLVRVIHVSGKRIGDQGEFVCEIHLEAHTGINPNDIP